MLSERGNKKALFAHELTKKLIRMLKERGYFRYLN